MVFPFARIVGFPVFRMFVRRVIGIENIPKSGPFIVAIKHLGSLDGFFVAAVLIPHMDRIIHFFANNPNWLGGWWRRIVAEKWSSTLTYQDKKGSLEKADALLKKGEVVGIFPEGRLEEVHAGRSRGKTGAARLALWNHVPIIPVGIHHKVSKSIGIPSLIHRRWVILNIFRHPRSYEIHIGKAFTLDPWYGKPVDRELLHKATDEIMRHLNQLTHFKEV